MENLPITTPALPPSGKVNTTTVAADAAPPDPQNGGDFDAALQRELAREPAATPSQAADKSAGDEAGENARSPDASLSATANDTIMALLAAPAAPAMAAPQPEPVQAAQASMTRAAGIDPGKAPAAASLPQSREHAALPEAATGKPSLTTAHEADSAASGKTGSTFATASAQAQQPTATEIKQQLSAEGTPPPVQSNALTALAGHAMAYPVSARTIPGRELQIAPPVGAAGWDGALAQKVVWLAGERQQVAELHLNPPHLGPLEVRVSVASDQSGVANAQFASPHAAVREAVEAAMPRLREILAESGITLGNTTVGNDSFRHQQGFTPADGRPVTWRVEAGAGAASPAGASLGVTRGARNGLVDIFA